MKYDPSEQLRGTAWSVALAMWAARKKGSAAVDQRWIVETSRCSESSVNRALFKRGMAVKGWMLAEGMAKNELRS